MSLPTSLFDLVNPLNLFGDFQTVTPSREELMQRWRTARETGKQLPDSEQAELSALIDAEVQASGERAVAALAGLER